MNRPRPADASRRPSTRSTGRHLRRWIGALLVVTAVAGGVGAPAAAEPADSVAAPTPTTKAGRTADPVLVAKATDRGSVRVIVQLATPVAPEAQLKGLGALPAQRAQIRADQDRVAVVLGGTGSVVARRFDTIAAMSVSATPAGLERLMASDLVVDVQEDRLSRPVLDGTTVLIEADQMHDLGFDGAGHAVAILDSGVDTAHPMFSDGGGGDRVVAEGCFSTTYAPYSSTSFCPGGAATSTATGSGVDCGAIDGCDHGTHVAGIAAGGEWLAGTTTIIGVAPAADIIAVQVFSRFNDSTDCAPSAAPCILSYDSDQIAGLEYVYGLRNTYEVASINMSLGGGRATSSCNGEAIAAVIGNLESVGIVTAIAAGNEGWSDAVSFPACVSDAVAVGSTTNGDLVSSFSNAHPTLIDVYAPGSGILSALPDGGFASWNGTSMATPHVAGAWAVMRDALAPGDDESVGGILALLKAYGTSVSSRQGPTALGFSHPRIKLKTAFDGLANTLLSVSRTGSGSGSVSSAPAGIDCGTTCTVIVASPTSYTLTASAEPGSTFVGWSGGGCSGTGTCVVNVSSSSVLLTAEFVLIPPPNDDFAAATVLAATPVPVSQTTSGATDEASEPVPSCTDSSGGSVWFRWTAPSAGTLVVDLDGSDFDTVVTVHTGSSLASLTEQDCNDDEAYPTVTTSRVSLPVTGGTTYRIRAAGYGGEAGQLELDATFTAAVSRLLSVSVSGPGAVVSSPLGVACGSDCSESFANGTSVTLTALSDSGASLQSWGGACSGSGSTCTVTMTAARSVSAVFADSGDFVPVSPARLLDTRPDGETVDGQERAFGVVGGGSTYELSVAGRAGVADGAEAVMLNVTAVSPTGNGFVTVWPCDRPQPTASTLNFRAGVNIANAFTVPLAADGTVCLFARTATHLVADVAGFHPAGSSFAPVTPARLLDTRSDGSTVDAREVGLGPVVGGATYTLAVAGRAGVAGGAEAVVLNVTAVSPTGNGFVTVWPCDEERPTASTLNFTAGVNIANAFTVPLANNGTVCLFTRTTTHLVADVAGFHPMGSSFEPVTPARLLDTRFDGATVDGSELGAGFVLGGSTYELSVAGRAGVAGDADAVVLNVTAVSPTGNGFVTVWPCGEVRPTASTLNFTAGVNIANAFTVPLADDGTVCLFARTTTHLVADVSGYHP